MKTYYSFFLFLVLSLLDYVFANKVLPALASGCFYFWELSFQILRAAMRP